MKIAQSIGVVLFLALSCRSTSAYADGLYMAFWNVENLFDLVDDADVEGDEEFTPNGPKKWSAERLEIKLRNLARVIQDMNDKKGPDVLGLSEIENRKVIELLIKNLKLKRDYAIVHQQSPSYRGIDCAILYDKKVLKLKGAKFHRIGGTKTRDIVEAHLQLISPSSGQAEFYAFSNHWPSRRSPDPARVKVAKVLRGRIDEILKKDKATDIVIMGDLNDFPDNISVRDTLNTTADREEVGVKLFNAMWPMHDDPDAGTYVYRNKWGVLDHFVLSAGLFDSKGLSYVPKSVTTVFNEYQYYRPTNGSIPRPSRSYSYNSFHANGYSDHLPIAAKFKAGK